MTPDEVYEWFCLVLLCSIATLYAITMWHLLGGPIQGWLESWIGG